jgi:nitroimidazol reductase NimA-like FMN-containing flavoprotein (pyridoxamine 5'-phosphate oxidase superfamily)
VTGQHRPSRLTEKFEGSTRAKLNVLLDEQHIGHFAFVVDGLPRVMPIAYVRDGDELLLHGSTGSPWLRLLGTGVPVQVSVSALDAIVVARSAFESSMQYRSAVLTGHCAAVTKDDRVRSLDLVTEGLLPGRTSEIRTHSAKELAATLTLRMTVDDWTLKISEDWPDDAQADIAGTAWAGIVPLVRGYAEPIPAPDLAAGIAVPESVKRLLG